jgi:5'-AMP-activated protein kinase regulatory beta subunit
LQNVGENNFVIEKTLPISIYYYRFIVDGHWTYAPDIDNSRL